MTKDSLAILDHKEKKAIPAVLVQRVYAVFKVQKVIKDLWIDTQNN